MSCVRRLVFVTVIATCAGLFACRKEVPDPRPEQAPRGLPPAGEITARPAPVPGEVGGMGALAGAAANPGVADPHGGMDPHGGADPHAGMGGVGGSPGPVDPGTPVPNDDVHSGMGQGGADPHAGMGDTPGPVDPGTPVPADDVHAGLGQAGGGGDPHAQMAPDSDRAIDASKFLRGELLVTDATRSQISPGDIVFVSVKPVNPVTGEVIGNTLAAARVDVTSFPLAFELTEANAMVAGTAFNGDVLVLARVDRDGEARTREPGDVEGKAIARIPSEGIQLTLDTVVK